MWYGWLPDLQKAPPYSPHSIARPCYISLRWSSGWCGWHSQSLCWMMVGDTSERGKVLYISSLCLRTKFHTNWSILVAHVSGRQTDSIWVRYRRQREYGKSFQISGARCLDKLLRSRTPQSLDKDRNDELIVNDLHQPPLYVNCSPAVA